MDRHSSPKASSAFASATHAALYAPEPASCDACGARLESGDDEEEGQAGTGMYLFARGDEVRREEVPLCPACSLAIGLAALADEDYEEEEG